MEKACKAAASSLRAGKSSLEAVAAAITVLENSSVTNAGKGSNLTFDGTVECDASVMDGEDGVFGSIAAAPGIKNPCAAATRLAMDSKLPLSHGRVRPVMLAGDAARVWALKQGLEAAATPEEAAVMHVTKEAQQKHRQYLNIIVSNTTSDDDDDQDDDQDDNLYDTVGCCVMNEHGLVAAGVSSGGIALKTPGRVGEGAVHGAGCWADNGVWHRVAVSVTGVGERIMRHSIARVVAEKMVVVGSDDKEECLYGTLENSVGKGPLPRDCGVICLQGRCNKPDIDDDGGGGGGGGGFSADLVAVHLHSKSMAVGYLAENGTNIVIGDQVILRQQRGERISSLSVGVQWPSRNLK